jgi:endonuclease YncB( thermonuclease family)
MLFRVLLALLVWALLPETGSAQVCTKGKPCGNTCIAQNRTCRVGPGTTRAAGTATTPATPAAPPPQTAVPEGALFVASTRGTTYYFVGCSGWRGLAQANLRWFRSREEAVAAGLRRSTQSGCQGTDAQIEAFRAATPSSPPADRRLASSDAIESRAICVVQTVVDGDTLGCADGRQIRLLLIDAPEMTQGGFGALAKQTLEQLSPAGTPLAVELDVQPQDPYGRLLAYLTLPDSRIVNEELLRRGVAVVSVYPPNVLHVDRFRWVEDAAQQAKAGLWALDAFACLPADHRAGRCEL